jgi:hypothetical protein
MKRLLKSWVFWVTCLLVLPAAYTILSGLGQEVRMYICSCGSGKTVSYWSMSWSFDQQVWSGRPVVAENPSDLLWDCFPSGHAHAWSQSYAGGSGPGIPLVLAMKYREDEKFRKWLRTELETGRVSRERVERESVSRAPFGYPR